MLDARRLLDSLMQAGMTDSSGQRVQNALGPQGLGGQPGAGGLVEQFGRMLGGTAGGQGGGGLGGMLGQLTGGGQGGGQGGGLGAILGQVVGGLQQSAGRAGEAVRSNDPLTVGGLGAIVGALLGGRSGAVGGGALALLGSLAYAALQAKGQGAAPGQGEAAPSEATLEQLTSEDTAFLLVRAMITAAKADGEIDQGEIDRIAGKLAEIGADEETRRWVMEEMRRPAELDGLVAQIPGPEVAAEVYAASLLAIEVDTEAERAYLAELARRLGLAPPVVAHIHRSLGIA